MKTFDELFKIALIHFEDYRPSIECRSELKSDAWNTIQDAISISDEEALNIAYHDKSFFTEPTNYALARLEDWRPRSLLEILKYLIEVRLSEKLIQRYTKNVE